MTHQKTTIAMLTTCLLLGIALSPCEAALVVEETFSGTGYSDEALVSDIDPALGTGWSGNWVGTNSGSGLLWSVESGMQTQTNFNTLTRSGVGPVTRDSATGIAYISRTMSTASQTALTADNTTSYFSLLVRPRGGGAVASDIGFAFSTDAFISGSPATVDNSGNGIGFFAGDNTDPSFNDGIYTTDWSGGTANVQTGDKFSYADDTTYLLVGQMDWKANGTNDTLTLYLVPSSGDFDPATASKLTHSVDLDQTLFDTITLSNNLQGVVDEIRLGTTMDSVLPGIAVVPEPATMSLLALGGIAMLRRRKK